MRRFTNTTKPKLIRQDNFTIPSMKLQKKFWQSWKFKFISGFALFFLFTTTILITMFIVANWFDQNKLVFQQPVIFHIQFQAPMLVEKRKTIIISPISKLKQSAIPQANAQMLNNTPEWQVRPDNVDVEKWNYIMNQPDAHLVSYIWYKESNYGRDAVVGSLDQHCRTIGQYNEFGLGGMADLTCFATFEANVQAVIKTLDGYGNISDKNKLCLYNVGINESYCPYLSNWNN